MSLYTWKTYFHSNCLMQKQGENVGILLVYREKTVDLIKSDNCMLWLIIMLHNKSRTFLYELYNIRENLKKIVSYMTQMTYRHLLVYREKTVDLIKSDNCMLWIIIVLHNKSRFFLYELHNIRENLKKLCPIWHKWPIDISCIHHIHKQFCTKHVK